MTDAYDLGLITETANKLFSKDYDLGFVRRFHEDPDSHRESLLSLCQEMGWHGLIIAEERGGFGYGFDALCALLEEMGSAAFPTIYFSHYVTPLLLLARLTDSAAVNELLSSTVEGEVVPCLLADTSTLASLCNRDTVRLLADGDGYRLNGNIAYVCDVDTATALLVPVPNDNGEVSVCTLPSDLAGLAIEKHEDTSFGHTYSVSFNEVAVSAEQLLISNALTALQQTYLLSAVAKSSELIGGANRAMAFALEHIMVRKQFGKLLAEFQAVQHQAADMYKSLDVARLFLKEAIEQITEGTDFEQSARWCKSWTNEANFQATATSHQLMGGTGYMIETDLHLLTLHGLRNQHEFGTSDYHREQVADHLGL